MIGVEIRKKRKEKGLSMEALAEKSGVSKSAVWRIENNIPVNGDFMIKVLKYLKMYSKFKEYYDLV